MKEFTTSSAAIWKYHHLARLGNYGRYDIVIELPAGDAKALGTCWTETPHCSQPSWAVRLPTLDRAPPSSCRIQ